MQKLSLAITTFNRFDLTIKSFEKVIDDERIDEILIVDDCSTDLSGFRLAEYFKDNPKVKVIIQGKNRSMKQNKADSVSFAKNEWIVLLDSDNEISSGYIDAIEALEMLHSHVIYAPVRALPTFIYDDFSGVTITKENVSGYVKRPFFGAMINTCNYLLNRNFYLENYKFEEKVKGVDTATHFVRHIENGGWFHIVPNMEYFHLTHSGSEFMKEIDYNMAMAKEIDEKLLVMSNT